MVLRIYTVGGAPEAHAVKSASKTRHNKPANPSEAKAAKAGGTQAKP